MYEKKKVSMKGLTLEMKHHHKRQRTKKSITFLTQISRFSCRSFFLVYFFFCWFWKKKKKYFMFILSYNINRYFHYFTNLFIAKCVSNIQFSNSWLRLDPKLNGLELKYHITPNQIKMFLF